MDRKRVHVQDNSDVANKYVNIYCNTKQFIELPFCGTHSKPHDARVSSNHYQFRFDPKRGNGVCNLLYTI